MVKFAFGEPPQDAVDYFEAKKLGDLYAFDYRDVWKREHVTNFVVAKATQLDVLTTLHEAVHQSIQDGTTLRDFKKNLQPKLEELGWWGRQSVIDPVTGQSVEAQLGSPRRLEIIYDTNKRQAQHAGKWQRIEATKRALPYLLYRLGSSKEHRPEHAAWDGICLPVDDPFWKTHTPMDGYGCKCWVQQISKKDFEKMQNEGVNASLGEQEINPDTGLPTGRIIRQKIPLITEAPKIELIEWKNKRTGIVERVPKGIDPGFDFNPGKERFESLVKMLEQKVQAAPPVIQKPFAENFVETYSNLYLAAADVAIAEQNATMTAIFNYWLKVYGVGKK